MSAVTGIKPDAQVQALLDAVGDYPYIDLAAMPLEQALPIARPELPVPPPPPNSADWHLPGDDGAQLRIRLYHPDEPAGREPRPLVLYLHGGGFVGGSIEMDDLRCARLADMAECIVASLAYRLAPENPFPAAIEDSYRAWRWLQDRAHEFGADPRRAAVYGSSAGGHLAVGLVRVTLQRGAVVPDFLLLANPALDPAMASASYAEFGDGPFMTAARMAWYWAQYRGAGEPGDGDIWSPMQSDTLSGFPPTHVMTAEYDVLRDEGEAFAGLLGSAGVPATSTRYAGMIHGFITVLPDHSTSKAAMEDSAAVVRARLAAD